MALVATKRPRCLDGKPAARLPLAVLAGIIISLDILRLWHHYLGVPWRAHDLLASFGVQASLSLTWALGAIALMASGHRRQQRRLWTAGAALMGIVVVKLFVVELGDSNGIARIVSFIGVGVLLLLVSYYAPAPKRRRGIAAFVLVDGWA